MCLVLLQEVAKQQESIFAEQEPILPFGSRVCWGWSSAGVLFSRRVQAAWMLSRYGVIREGRLANQVVANDPSALGRKIALLVDPHSRLADCEPFFEWVPFAN